MSKTFWIIFGIVVIAGLGSWLAVTFLPSGQPVEAARAERGLIREYIDERAKTRLPETYLVTMPFAGRVEPITLSEGAPVTKGQVVARIVPGDLALQVALAEAAVEQLDASLRENADVGIEQTGVRQAERFVASVAAVVKAALEQVNAGEASYNYAEKNFSRVQRLAATGSAAPDALDQATTEMLRSGFELKQDQFVYAAMEALQAATDLLPTMVRQYIERKGLQGAVIAAQKQQSDVRLREAQRDQQRGSMESPVDGTVLRRAVSNERFLPAGETLLEIGRLDQLEVEAEVLTLDVVEAKVGDQVDIYGPAIGQPPARGTVSEIYPAGFTKVSSLGVEQQRVMVIIRFAADELKRLRQERGLGVGYRVRAKIFTAEKPDALIVPRSALFRGAEGQWQVFAIRDGRADLTSVEVGLLNDEQAEIVKGLSDGELVVLAPESSLESGTRVEPRVRQPAP